LRKMSLQEEAYVYRRVTLGFLCLLALSACAELGLVQQREAANAPEEAVEAVSNPELSAPPPPPAARTVEQFDTTTEEQRVAASAPPSGGTLLGTTIASLGDPGRPGFWAETDLVSDVTQGRLVFPATGKSVEVELTPAAGGGSRVSLAAMRVLEAPLTDLPVLEVYAN